MACAGGGGGTGGGTARGEARGAQGGGSAGGGTGGAGGGRGGVTGGGAHEETQGQGWAQEETFPRNQTNQGLAPKRIQVKKKYWYSKKEYWHLLTYRETLIIE